MEIRILIGQKGDWRDTQIFFNGKPLKRLCEFNFSIRVGGKCKAQIKAADNNGRLMFMSFYAEDFAKIDECDQESPREFIGENWRDDNEARRQRGNSEALDHRSDQAAGAGDS